MVLTDFLNSSRFHAEDTYFPLSSFTTQEKETKCEDDSRNRWAYNYGCFDNQVTKYLRKFMKVTMQRDIEDDMCSIQNEEISAGQDEATISCKF